MSKSNKVGKQSYRTIITLSFIFISIIPLIIFGIISINLITNNMEKDVSNKNTLLAASLASEVDIFLRFQKNVLLDICSSIEKKNYNEADLLEYLYSVVNHHVFYESIQYINEKGEISLAVPQNNTILGYSMINHPSVTEPLKTGETYYSEPFLSLSSGEISITVSKPCLEGVVVVYINLGLLGDIIRRVDEGISRFAFMTDSKGVVIAHPDKMQISQRSNVRNLNIVKNTLSGLEDTYRYYYEQMEHIGSSAIVGETGWPIIITQPVMEAFSIVRGLRNFLWIGVLIVLVSSIIISIFYSRRIVKPITILASSTRKISGGDYDYSSITHSSYREIEALSNDFLIMTKAVEDREQKLLNNEKELKAARNYLRDVFNSLNSILIAVNQNGEIHQWNRSAEKFTGFPVDQIINMDIWDKMPFLKIFKPTFDEVFKSDETREIQNVKIDGKSKSFFNISFYPLFFQNTRDVVIRIDDVTENVHIHELMIQSEKMLSVGGLAAGMAHEINNPLAGMIQTARVLSNRLGGKIAMPANIKAAEEAGISMKGIKEFIDSRGIPRMLSTINESGRRIAEIVNNMLSFARKGEGQFSSLSLNDLIDKTIGLASTDYDLKKQYDFKDIEIIKEYDKDLPPIPCEEAKIQQVLLNLFRNGAQAMATTDGFEQKSPKLIIRTYFDKKSQMACIEVEDNGPGMDEDIRKRIFEPFFTTKPVGIGTGLGLSVSYFIISKNHKGEMEVDSTPGKGTTFIIHLPI